MSTDKNKNDDNIDIEKEYQNFLQEVKKLQVEKNQLLDQYRQAIIEAKQKQLKEQ